ncbi:hypothetical protein [Neisseria sp.]|uniref:hypothetical protein n=1 Tax=Neisseria sp. TaxID=192066 RepID=UPI002898A9C0|nr:hypothetical protein [Neisseria sp.]
MFLFLAKYPQTEIELRDGYFQRIENIDYFFRKDKRIYLNVSITKNKKKTKRIVDNRTEVSCNVFLHFFLILSIFKSSKIVYIHSIYNTLANIFFIVLFKKFYVLDLHGVVPEELKMQKKFVISNIFTVIENIIFRKLNITISVTKKMQQYYENLYANPKNKYLIYAILPSIIDTNKSINNLNSDNQVVRIIYSGNTQVWQNIDLMIHAIKKNINKNISYTILTGEPEAFKQVIKNFELENEDSITIKSVTTDQLGSFYSESHYGFILRDDILINQVACPTKLVEYLSYGIIPIVLSPDIGDFKEMGYEYLLLDEFSKDIPLKKSLTNQKVIEKIKSENSYNLRDKVLSIAKISI